MPHPQIISIYKKLGETPLECLERFKREQPEYTTTSLTYLGRLDPMAEGLLLIAPGNINRGNFLDLDKSYEFEVLWGVESDTYDMLGLVNVKNAPEKLEEQMPAVLDKLIKIQTQNYPVFSSKSFKGDYLKARNETDVKAVAKSHPIKIYSIEHTQTRSITRSQLLTEVETKIGLVKGDFRQTEIIKSWKSKLSQDGGGNYLVSKFKADVSSGTYIRGLANEMGRTLNSAALAWSIKRTRVGTYTI